MSPLKKAENHQLFSRYGVLSETEMLSRYEVSLEEYRRKIRIEGGVALEIARSMILGAATDEYIRLGNALALSASGKMTSGSAALRKAMDKLGCGIDEFSADCDRLEAAMAQDDDDILPALQKLRKAADSLEYLVDDRVWPLPKYREMLFIY